MITTTNCDHNSIILYIGFKILLNFLKLFAYQHLLTVGTSAQQHNVDVYKRQGLGIACVPDYMLKENDQLTPLMLKEPLPGRQLVLAQHDNLTVSQAAERFIEMFASL